jgi:hypothetical protein
MADNKMGGQLELSREKGGRFAIEEEIKLQTHFE